MQIDSQKRGKVFIVLLIECNSSYLFYAYEKLSHLIDNNKCKQNCYCYLINKTVLAYSLIGFLWFRKIYF